MLCNGALRSEAGHSLRAFDRFRVLPSDLSSTPVLSSSPCPVTLVAPPDGSGGSILEFLKVVLTPAATTIQTLCLDPPLRL